jgi:hypothetical protein
LPTAGAQSGIVLAPPREIRDVERCATGDERLRQLGLRPRVVPSLGEGLSFTQDPPVLAPDYLGTITLRDFHRPRRRANGAIPPLRRLAGDRDLDAHRYA